jgi:prevent-host-death family protein
MAMRSVGAFEAKTHLAALLDAVSAGEQITITRHGRPVARLVPPAAEPALPREWTDGVAHHAALLPLSDLQSARTQWQPFLARAGQRELFIYCAVGGRAGIAAKLLAAEGFKVANTGGLTDWLDADWPIVKP